MKPTAKLFLEVPKMSIVQSKKKIQTFLYSHLKENHNFSHSLVRLGQEIAGFSLIFVCFVVWKESFSFDTNSFVILLETYMNKFRRFFLSLIRFAPCAEKDVK